MPLPPRGVSEADQAMEDMMNAPAAQYGAGEVEDASSGEIIEIANKKMGEESYACVTVRVSPEQAAGLQVGMKVDLGGLDDGQSAEVPMGNGPEQMS